MRPPNKDNATLITKKSCNKDNSDRYSCGKKMGSIKSQFCRNLTRWQRAESFLSSGKPGSSENSRRFVSPGFEFRKAYRLRPATVRAVSRTQIWSKISGRIPVSGFRSPEFFRSGCCCRWGFWSPRTGRCCRRWWRSWSVCNWTILLIPWKKCFHFYC